MAAKTKSKDRHSEDAIRHIKVMLEKELENITEVDIGDFCREIMTIYGASIAIARIAPDIRDGLKPVERRILYAMEKLGLKPEGKNTFTNTLKCARIVGEVIGKFAEFKFI